MVNGAVLTSLLTPQRTSPASQTKPGRAPQGVEYVGTTSISIPGLSFLLIIYYFSHQLLFVICYLDQHYEGVNGA